MRFPWQRKPPDKLFTPGMTLAPGESAMLPLDLDLSEVLSADTILAIHEGRLKLEIQQEPVVQSGNYYESVANVLVNGVLVATMHISYEGKP